MNLKLAPYPIYYTILTCFYYYIICKVTIFIVNGQNNIITYNLLLFMYSYKTHRYSLALPKHSI